MRKRTQANAIEQIRKGSRHLVRELDVVNGVYLGTGYTLTQCHVLFELSARGKLGLMDLAKNLLMDKSNASRTVKKLVELGLVKTEKDTKDSRQKFFSLTSSGRKALAATIHLADEQVESALEFLNPEQQETVIDGLALYSEALRKSRLQAPFSIRKIQKADESQIAKIIREVMAEFEATGEGYSESDVEVDSMYSSYRGKKSAYFVVENDQKVVGGGGLAKLEGGDGTVCEIRKMFFLPVARGLGLGRKLLIILLDKARERGYSSSYIETLKRMENANALYESLGFKKLKKPLGDTGHSKADTWYLREL